MSGFAAAFLVGSDANTRLRELRQRNILLTSRVDTLRTRFALLTGKLTALAEREREYRQLAGLAPLRTVHRGRAWTAGRLSFAASRPIASGNARTAARDRNGLADMGQLANRAQRAAARWNLATLRLLTSAPTANRLPWIPSILPTRGFLTNRFTVETHPLLDGAVAHQGIDIAAPAGNLVWASAHGRVARTDEVPGYGLLVVLDHGNGYVTKYAHLRQIRVEPGQLVQRGERIGTVGESGLTAGPHLHYEVLLDGLPQQPLDHVLELARK